MNLGDEVHTFVEKARAMTDWRLQWRRHPWMGCLAALGLGYLVIPTRKFGPADARRLDELAQVTAAAAPSSPARQLAFKLGGLALGFVAQRGVRFLGEQIEQFVAAHARSHETVAPEMAGSHDYEQ